MVMGKCWNKSKLLLGSKILDIHQGNRNTFGSQSIYDFHNIAQSQVFHSGNTDKNEETGKIDQLLQSAEAVLVLENAFKINYMEIAKH